MRTAELISASLRDAVMRDCEAVERDRPFIEEVLESALALGWDAPGENVASDPRRGFGLPEDAVSAVCIEADIQDFDFVAGVLCSALRVGWTAPKDSQPLEATA